MSLPAFDITASAIGQTTDQRWICTHMWGI